MITDKDKLVSLTRALRIVFNDPHWQAKLIITGIVTLISQDLSEFALHARAILSLPVPAIRQHGPSASCAILLDGDSDPITYSHVERALAEPDTMLRLFGKPEVRGHRRMGVALALGATLDEARAKARAAAEAIVAGARVGG